MTKERYPERIKDSYITIIKTHFIHFQLKMDKIFLNTLHRRRRGNDQSAHK